MKFYSLGRIQFFPTLILIKFISKLLVLPYKTFMLR